MPKVKEIEKIEPVTIPARALKLAETEEIAAQDAFRVCIVNKKTGARRWYTDEELKKAGKI